VSEDPDLASVEDSMGPEALRFRGLITGGIALQEVPKDGGQKKDISASPEDGGHAHRIRGKA
jgi:hypothetical protein